jgi:hypothetical protein
VFEPRSAVEANIQIKSFVYTFPHGKMGRHTIPAGAFFTYSPDLSFRCPSSQDDTVLEAIRWTEERKEKGGEMNCFLRSSSNEERDGHLARLLGVQRMHALLLVLQDNAKVKYYGKVSIFYYIDGYIYT